MELHDQVWTILLIVGGAMLTLAVAWGAALTRQKHMSKDIEEISEKLDKSNVIREALKKEYLTVESHKLLCSNNTFEIKAHVSEVVETMGTTLVDKIENIIKTNGMT